MEENRTKTTGEDPKEKACTETQKSGKAQPPESFTPEELLAMATAVVMEAEYDENRDPSYPDMYCRGKVFTPSKAADMLRYGAEAERERRTLRFACDKIEALCKKWETCFNEAYEKLKAVGSPWRDLMMHPVDLAKDIQTILEATK